MRIVGHEVGVCSWSLRPGGMADLVQKVKSLGLEHVQLALSPLLALDEPARQAELDVLAASGLTITAGMIDFAGEDYSSIATIRETGGITPAEPWEQRRARMAAAADLAAQLKLQKLSFHAGFLPSSGSPLYAPALERIQEAAEIFAVHDLWLLMETGQERANELLQFLNDLPARNVDVNFDPANMILYGAGDPIEAIKTLDRHIRHCHVKDALLSDQPGTKWGSEVPFGQGQVGPEAFLNALHAVEYRGPLMIEREAGDDRLGDVRLAIEALRRAARE